ncbi:MAG: HDOD domain-containing protein [Pirellulaceae bacterium]
MLQEATPAPSSPIERFLTRAGELYSLPAVAMEVLRLTENRQVDTRKIKECIERDPALTLKILKAVNSPAFGLSGKVCDLNQALALLGIKPLKLLVLGFSLPRNLGEGFHRRALARYWEYALTEAVAAREISRSLRLATPDEALLCGLVAEVGTLILLGDLGESYADFLLKVEREGADLIALELETIGFDHLILGVRLLQSWNLPATMTEAIAQSRIVSDSSTSRLADSSSPQVADLAGVLTMARLLAEILVRQRTDLLPELLERLAEAGGSELALEQTVIVVQRQMLQMAEALVVSVDPQGDYGEVMLTAYQRLGQVAADAAPELAQKAEWPESARLATAIDQAESANEVSPGSTVVDESSPAGRASVPDFARWEPAVESAVRRARDLRSPLSLMWLQVVGFPEQVSTWDLNHVERLLGLAGVIAEKESDHLATSLPGGDGVLVVLLPDFDRQPAVELTRRVIDQAARWSGRLSGDQGPTLSAGIATVTLPPRNFRVADLLESAHRCANAAQSSGGNGVKSIEVL